MENILAPGPRRFSKLDGEDGDGEEGGGGGMLLGVDEEDDLEDQDEGKRPHYALKMKWEELKG